MGVQWDPEEAEDLGLEGVWAGLVNDERSGVVGDDGACERVEQLEGASGGGRLARPVLVVEGELGDAGCGHGVA